MRPRHPDHAGERDAEAGILRPCGDPREDPCRPQVPGITARQAETGAGHSRDEQQILFCRRDLKRDHRRRQRQHDRDRHVRGLRAHAPRQRAHRAERQQPLERRHRDQVIAAEADHVRQQHLVKERPDRARLIGPRAQMSGVGDAARDRHDVGERVVIDHGRDRADARDPRAQEHGDRRPSDPRRIRPRRGGARSRQADGGEDAGDRQQREQRRREREESEEREQREAERGEAEAGGGLEPEPFVGAQLRPGRGREGEAAERPGRPGHERERDERHCALRACGVRGRR